MKVSIVLPFIRESVKTTIALAKKNHGIDEIEIVSEEDRERIGCPKMVKKLVERSKFDLVCFLGDDTLPTHNFLKYAIEDMQNLPDGWGLVGLNDGTGRTLATHWLADKRLLPMLDGEFFHTGYTHCCSDQELQTRCSSVGRYVYSQKSVVMHNHPLLTYADWDADYKRVYSKEIWGADQELFEKRRKNGWKNTTL
jgi:hypothetical protein